MTVTPNPASAAADTTADALETTRKLLGEPRIVVLSRGREVPVHGYRFAQLFAVLSAAQPIFDAVASRPNEPLMQVVGDHREAVIRLVSLSTGLDGAELEALPVLDGVKLAHAVYDENDAFFRQELMPMFLMALSSQLAKSSSSSTTAAATGAVSADTVEATSTAGHGLQTDSSAAATPGAMSAA